MDRPKVSSERKLFLGLKLDNTMRRHLENGNAVGRPIFKPGDPACLDLVEEKGELYVGRVIDAGFAVEDLDDLKRNIRSIVAITFAQHRPSSPLRLFSIEDAAVSRLAAAV
jgi:hypothetical protein